MLRKYSDIYSSIILLIFATVMYVATFSFKRLTDTVVGSEFAPRLVAGGIFILSIILLVQGILKVRNNQEDKSEVTEFEVEVEVEDEGNESTEVNYVKVSLTILLFAAYIALLKPIGFLIMTTIYLAITMLLLSTRTQRNIPLFVIVSVFVSVSVYYVFKDIFYLILPAGILG